MPGGRASTGSTSATAPSSDPFSRCAIPAPTRIWAQFAETFGAPADQAASAAAAACNIAPASPSCVATDCAKTACRVRGNDQAESPESGVRSSAARAALARAAALVGRGRGVNRQTCPCAPAVGRALPAWLDLPVLPQVLTAAVRGEAQEEAARQGDLALIGVDHRRPPLHRDAVTGDDGPSYADDGLALGVGSALPVLADGVAADVGL